MTEKLTIASVSPIPRTLAQATANMRATGSPLNAPPASVRAAQMRGIASAAAQYRRTLAGSREA